MYFTKRWDEHDPWPESQPWHPQLRSLLHSEISGDSFGRYLINPRIDLSRLSSLTLVTDSIEWREKIMQATKLGSGGVEHLRLWDSPGQFFYT